MGGVVGLGENNMIILNQFFTDPIALRVAQVLCAAIFARQNGIHLERETIISLVHSFFQIVIVSLTFPPPNRVKTNSMPFR
jgi:hypothetical protein